MTTLLNMIETNIHIMITTINAICILLLVLWLKARYQSNKYQNKLKEMEQEKIENHYMFERLSDKYADLNTLAVKTETEKMHWQEQAYKIEKDFLAYKTIAETKVENLNEKITYLEKIKEDLTLKFKDISSEIIKSQNETFTITQKNTLSAIINPFAEQLKSFKEEVSAAKEVSIKNKSSLDTQLANLANMNLTLCKEAENLTEALKGGKKIQGNWGECQLNRILEISGLRLGQDYETQETLVNEDKKLYRPDVIVHLPQNRDIIIDSKVSLTDYLDAINTDNEAERQKSLQKNVDAIKAHIDELSAKEYQKLLKERTLNYVIMFIPVESAYIAALDYDRYIYDYAYKKNVILATPLSLLPTLRTIENLWRIDNQNQNVQKIAELGGKIYDKLAAFVEDMKILEKGILQADNAYKNAMIKLSGRGGAISQAEKMKQLGAKSSKNINLALNDNDLLLQKSSDETENIAINTGE